MQQSTLVWLLSGTLSVVLMALAFFSKTLLTQVLKRLDDIIQELKNLSRISATQEEQIRNIQHTQDDQADKLSEHADAIAKHTERIVRLESHNIP